ncbi:hypothetical protein HAX54_029695 [Datura stramonium]|uniref:Uncharacterized protein n=1 Tax=Datura stramonium TaxID=4076 RepID=A0ABS8V716_DATST|nr:hypothetical protein [Datura stramonium]
MDDMMDRMLKNLRSSEGGIKEMHGELSSLTNERPSIKAPYREINHSLSGPKFMARWIRHQQFGERVCLVLALTTSRPVNVGVIMNGVLRRAREKKGQRFSFENLMTGFLRIQQIED